MFLIFLKTYKYFFYNINSSNFKSQILKIQRLLPKQRKRLAHFTGTKSWPCHFRAAPSIFLEIVTSANTYITSKFPPRSEASNWKSTTSNYREILNAPLPLPAMSTTEGKPSPSPDAAAVEEMARAAATWCAMHGLVVGDRADPVRFLAPRLLGSYFHGNQPEKTLLLSRRLAEIRDSSWSWAGPCSNLPAPIASAGVVLGAGVRAGSDFQRACGSCQLGWGFPAGFLV
jgi:hypothetical protein